MLFSSAPDFQSTPSAHAAPSIPEGEDNDEQLMARMKEGDESALVLLSKRHRGLIRTIVGRVVNNDTDTEELTIEVWHEAWRQAAHYDAEKGKALGWLVTLARRRAIDRLRKKQTYQRVQDRLMEQTSREPVEALRFGGNDEAVSTDRAEVLQGVIAKLPPAQQEALTLAFFKGMSQREIAHQTGIPLGTIKTRLELALRKVRTAVLAMGGKAEWGFEVSHN